MSPAKSAKPGGSVIVIIGPTASGKTQLGIDLAKHLDSFVVSADSRQVYAGMNIGTATPPSKDGFVLEPHDVHTPDVIQGVDHFLLNIRAPNQPLSLAQWQTAAFDVLDSRTQDPESRALLVGGTMLYVDSIVKNYDLPQVAPNQTLREELERVATEELYERLLQQDPAVRNFIDPHNKRRIIRALEVMAATDRPFSTQRQQRTPRYPQTIIGVFPGWNILADRIARRVQNILDDGLLEETKQLQDRFGSDLPLLSTLNYRQATLHLNGTLSQHEMIADMEQENLRYAKRQMSWWKKRKEILWLKEPKLDEVLKVLE